MPYGWAMNGVNRSKFMTNRRRKFARRYPRINNLADTAAKIFGLQKQVNIIKGLVNSEMKFFDYAPGALTATSSGTVALLNGMVQGTDANTRVGNSIMDKYINCKLIVSRNSAATLTYFRYIVFVDKNNQGTAPAVLDVLSLATVSSQKNLDNTDRFWVLADRTIALDNTGRSTAQQKIFRRLNFHSKYYGPNATNVDTNALYLLVITDQTVNTPSYDFSSRLAYHDN